MYRSGFIILLVAAIYGSTLHHGFVWDDNFIIVNNPVLEQLSNIPQFFLAEDTVDESSGYYRPVTYISFALDRAVWGGNPAGFHLTNLILHILAVLLFFAATEALFKKERLAFVAALIFALHPIAGESINFLSGGRNTLLCACFALLSLLCYIRKKPVAALASFTVAIFAKEFALLLPLIFLGYDYRLQRATVRFRGYLLYLIPVACYLLLRSLAVQKANFLSAINMTDAATAPYLVVRYALNMIAPVQLKVLYDFPPGRIMAVLCLAVLLAMIGGMYYLRKHDDLLLSSCWFLLFLLPVINIIPLHITTVMADRYAYFSLMGFALFLAALLCKLKGRAVTAAVVILCALYAAIDLSRNGAWQDDIAFFTRMTHDAPHKFAGFKNLGMVYYRKGEISQAIEILAAADAKTDISYKYLVGDAYVYWKENMADKAEQALLRAQELEPGNPEPYLMLMMINEQKGNSPLAESYRDKVKQLGHDVDTILVNRVIELCHIGETGISRRQYVDAEINLWQALRINPAFVPALIDMGRLRAEQGKPAEALPYFSRALALEPSNAAASSNLVLVFQQLGRTAAAEAEMIRLRAAEAGKRQPGSQPTPGN